MSITINIRYKGENGSALKFAQEMIESGTVDKIKKIDGNLRYEYYLPLYDKETILLIDSWSNQAAIDKHHQSEMMEIIKNLRDKYKLSMDVERYILDEVPENDKKFIKN